MAAATPISTVPAKHPKGSITGFILALISLPIAAIGDGLVHAHYKSAEPITSTSGKVGDAVASGTGHVVSSLIGLPFLVIGFALAAIAVVFVLARLTKGLKFGALFFSALSLLLSIWSFSLVITAFSLLKAHR